MTRIKTIYPTNEIAHLWIHQKVEFAKNPGHNLYFEGKTIYSYGRHFPIAVILERDSNKILVNSNTYSQTTASHKSKVLGAVYHKERLEVPEPESEKYPSKHETNLKYFIGLVKETLELQAKAKTKDYLPIAFTAIENFETYLNWFPEINIKKILNEEELKYINKRWIEDEGLKVTKINIKLAKEREKEALKRRIEENNNRIKEWKEGKNLNLHYSEITYLRLRSIESYFIETSKGMKINLEEAKNLFKTIQYYKLKGGYSKVLSENKIEIKGFSVDWIRPYGDIKIGCHTILWSEIEEIARKLKWIK